jgi:hypothetical protein
MANLLGTSDQQMPSQSVPSDKVPEGTPLAPSVEKAYYRKCIALKRRLNEVETANDEARLRRVRLDRAIMKMRLERAFLLDELRKRMDTNVDGSEGSGEEGMATPPPDRPHRDKRRRPTSDRPGAAAPSNTFQTSGYTPSASRHPSDPNIAAASGTGNNANEENRRDHPESSRSAQPPPLQHGNPYDAPSSARSGAVNGTKTEGGNDREDRAMGEAGAGAGEESNGGRRSTERDQGEDSGRGAFFAVNH